jgi:hypothetical protein
MHDGEFYLPHFESIRDNFGHSWVHGINIHNYVLTTTILRPGNLLIFTVVAHNPFGHQLFYQFSIGPINNQLWQLESSRTFEITTQHLSRSIAVYLKVKRKLKHSFIELEENMIQFRYTVVL